MTADSFLADVSRWADDRGLPFDTDLVGVLLELRGTYDRVGPTSWPKGSVEHLLLVRFPAHGPLTTPPEDAVADGLETLFLHLHATNALTGDSAEVGALVGELHRAVPQMREANADRNRWSPGRVLMQFGKEIGIDLDTAETDEEADEMIDRLQDAWNALTPDEREARMPTPATPLAGEDALQQDDTANGLPVHVAEVLATATDDELADLLGMPADMPAEERTQILTFIRGGLTTPSQDD